MLACPAGMFQRMANSGAHELKKGRRMPQQARTRTALRAVPPMFNPHSPTRPRSREEITDIYSTPLLDLVYKAASVHRMYNAPAMVRGAARAASG